MTERGCRLARMAKALAWLLELLQLVPTSHPEKIGARRGKVYRGVRLQHAAISRHLLDQPGKVLRVTTDDQGPLVVLLHGFAGRPEDLEPFARSIGVRGRFVFPEGFADLSSFQLPGRGWWPSDGVGRAAAISSGMARDLSDYEPKGLERAHTSLGILLDELCLETRGAPLILGGFSQGAMLAFDIALRSDRPVAALVQLSGGRIARRLWQPRLATRAGTRAFISHGRLDADLAFSAAEDFAGELGSAGWVVDFCPFDGGHEVPLVALRRLKRFLRDL
jgi:phospholipase/carboxylesterase